MAYSWEQQIYPTGSQNVTVSIAYLDKSFIYVYLDGVLTTNYTWASDAVIRLDTPLTATTEILLVRRTEKEYLFIEFASGAPFISENLDTQNTQFLHLAQEMVEGRSIEGFYGDISMNGYKITNLGRGTEPGDAVNMEQLGEVDTRVTQLEQTLIVPTSSYPWFTNTTEETDVLTPGFIFTKAAVYINGVCQTPGYSYEVVDNAIMLADPVPAGTHVMARLGEDVPNEEGYATTAQLANLDSITAKKSELVSLNVGTNILPSIRNFNWQQYVFRNGERIYINGATALNAPITYPNALNYYLEVVGVLSTSSVEVRITPITSTNAYIPYSITASGLPGSRVFVIRSELTSAVAVTVAQGGTGASTAEAARTNLGLGTLATRSQGAAVANAAAAPTQAEFNALLTSLRNAGIIAT